MFSLLIPVSVLLLPRKIASSCCFVVDRDHEFALFPARFVRKNVSAKRVGHNGVQRDVIDNPTKKRNIYGIPV